MWKGFRKVGLWVRFFYPSVRVLLELQLTVERRRPIVVSAPQATSNGAYVKDLGVHVGEVGVVEETEPTVTSSAAAASCTKKWRRATCLSCLAATGFSASCLAAVLSQKTCVGPGGANLSSVSSCRSHMTSHVQANSTTSSDSHVEGQMHF